MGIIPGMHRGTALSLNRPAGDHLRREAYSAMSERFTQVYVHLASGVIAAGAKLAGCREKVAETTKSRESKTCDSGRGRYFLGEDCFESWHSLAGLNGFVFARQFHPTRYFHEESLLFLDSELPLVRGSNESLRKRTE